MPSKKIFTDLWYYFSLNIHGHTFHYVQDLLCILSIEHEEEIKNQNEETTEVDKFMHTFFPLYCNFSSSYESKEVKLPYSRLFFEEESFHKFHKSSSIHK